MRYRICGIGVFVFVSGLFSACVFAASVPDLPSDVYVDAAKNILMVQKPGDIPRPFMIRGVTWSPSTRAPKEGPNPLYPGDPDQNVPYGFFFDWTGRNPQGHQVLAYWMQRQILDNYAIDIPLMKQMNVNAVRIFQNLGSDAAAYKQVLDEFYRNGIMVVMTVAASKEDLESATYMQVVEACRNHPAILAWAIGNEWNLNKLYGYGDFDLAQAANAVNTAAAEIKALDRHHPVTSVLGDVFEIIPVVGCSPSWLVKDILARCPDVDFWGLNIYRGANFGNLFTQWTDSWLSIGQPTKPFYFSEFGIDSFATLSYRADGQCLVRADDTTGVLDQQSQADIDVALWDEIKGHLSISYPGQACLGGLIHEFNDELWKAGSYHVGLGGLLNYDGPDRLPGTADDDHSYDDYNGEGFVLQGRAPDNVFNEEHFGLVDADRKPKSAFNIISNNFKPELAVADIKFYQPRTEIETIPKAGQLVTCKAVLKNAGSDFTGIFNVKWFLDGNQVGYGSHEDLYPGQTSQGNVRFDWMPAAGSHTLLFVADADNHVQEPDENNNSFSKAVMISLPLQADLTVTDIKFYQPRTEIETIPKAGQLVTCKAILSNIGDAATGVFNVKWFLDGRLVGYGSHGALSPGQASEGNVRFDWVPAAGGHTLQFVADSDNHITEKNELNNTFIRTTQLNLSPVARIITYNRIGRAPLAVKFYGNRSYDLDGRILSYKWDFGNAATSNEINPTYTFRSNTRYNFLQRFRRIFRLVFDDYMVTLTVTDDKGAVQATKTMIRVYRAYW